MRKMQVTFFSKENISPYVSVSDEIVSGGAVGVDRCAADFAARHRLKLTELFIKYAEKTGKECEIVLCK